MELQGLEHLESTQMIWGTEDTALEGAQPPVCGRCSSSCRAAQHSPHGRRKARSSSSHSNGSLGASRGLEEIFKDSSAPWDPKPTRLFHMLLSASLLLSTGLFISVRAVAINSMIKKSHSSESMR